MKVAVHLEMISRTCADGFVVLVATKNDDTNQSGGLTISHMTDGSPLLPDVDLKGLPPPKQLLLCWKNSYMTHGVSSFKVSDSGDIEVLCYRLCSTFGINSQNSLGQIG